MWYISQKIQVNSEVAVLKGELVALIKMYVGMVWKCLVCNYTRYMLTVNCIEKIDNAVCNATRLYKKIKKGE